MAPRRTRQCEQHIQNLDILRQRGNNTRVIDFFTTHPDSTQAAAYPPMASLNTLLRLVAAALGLFVLLWAFGWVLLPDLDTQAFDYSEEQIAQAREARDVSFSPEDLYALHVQPDTPVTPTGQSPILAELVEQGELPPLTQRLPDKPIVRRGRDGIGRYGGTWLRLANSPSDVGVMGWRMSGATLARWSPLGYPVVPHIAESITPNEDTSVWTVKLREGLRWSDGEPFTVDDILYRWNDEVNNDVLNLTPPDYMRLGETYGELERVDRYTVRFVFDRPYPLFLLELARDTSIANTPRHYLSQYHPDPDIGDEQVCQDAMAAYGVPSRTALYSHMKNTFNPEHPRMWPWVYRTYKANPPQVFVRNPYYYVIDEAGNQLPYIDRVQVDVQQGSTLAISSANGGVTMQTRHMRFEDYTEMMSRREAAGTKVLHWYPASRSVYVINPNINRRVDPNEPATRWKAQLLADKRFRRAMSLAIDRASIITADYNGLGEPSQVEPGPESPFHSQALRNAYVDFDPDRANAMLDELDLDQRDAEGYRTFPDGTRMVFYLDTTAFTGVGPAQFVIDDWADVGVRVILRQRNRTLFYLLKNSRNFDFNVWTAESDFVPLLSPRYFIPQNTESFYAVGWGKWYMRGGFYGSQLAADSPGAIPVPKDHPMYRAIVEFERALRSITLEGQQEHMAQVLDIAADNVWTINITTPPPQPVIVDADLRNVPDNALYGAEFMTPANAGIELYYFEHPNDSPGAIADTRQALLQVTPRPGSSNATTKGGTVGSIIRWTLIAIAAVLIAMLIQKHPFVGRRLIILTPTLLVISIVIFTIIQLPPGDYLTNRIVQLQESGDPADLQAIEDLKEYFRYEDPVWVQYLRWMGIKWFVTFDPGDAGLLQGSLGRSMETTQPVNDMVGDRILLTLCISIGTIAFTWLTAIPIGIYSAVRQYSISDYILTFIGFVGMSVPAFLLALVLSAVSDVSLGLFSAEYAAQPEWTWGKFLDLLTHIWLPIVVLGVGGTAGMIRVMRANLLDELGKPYVVTAMAKGVRPVKLLFKYPVRLALNPFISGIGGLFPQLVSGGAIVALVLSLPTVGPLLLSSLLSQDMYLAGSMLMVLSLLGVLGTLVSDLLLLWLDPRIRFEGGSR